MTEDAAVRRRTMQAVRSEDTKPELAIRRLVSGLGYRYRLHRKDLPGTPRFGFYRSPQGRICTRLLLAWSRLPERRAYAKDQ